MKATTSGRSRARASSEPASSSLAARVEAVLASIKRKSTARDRANLARFGIVAPKSFGVSMANLQLLAKQLGRDHQLALALWDTGWYEARMLACIIDEPALVTRAQMDAWCRDFDNWAICDTACFHLFDKTPHAWSKINQWSSKRGEFQRRAAFALMASVALHDKLAADAPFLHGLVAIEKASDDERNFVKKGVLWALRGIGTRNAVLHAAATTLARRLSEAADPTQRWIGKNAARELAKRGARAELMDRSRVRSRTGTFERR